jgi:flagellar protein FliO/FliZ
VDNVLLALRVVVSLGVVIGAIWFVQRRVGRSGPRKSSTKPISVVAKQSLGAKASVAVVEFSGKQFLLGVTEHGISVLHNGDSFNARDDAFAREELFRSGAATLPSDLPEPRPARISKHKAVVADFDDAMIEAELEAELAAAATGPTRMPAMAMAASPAASASSAPAQLAPQPKLAGSIVSATTWKQAFVALRGGK